MVAAVKFAVASLLQGLGNMFSSDPLGMGGDARLAPERSAGAYAAHALIEDWQAMASDWMATGLPVQPAPVLTHAEARDLRQHMRAAGDAQYAEDYIAVFKERGLLRDAAK